MINVVPLSGDELSKINVPVLVFAGELDSFYEGAKRSANYLPQSQFISLPDRDHGSTFEKDVILPNIKEFLAK